ncbi:arrestin domain-containing protein 1-like [Mytilus trossulus]|uniref:arrestin domain-containing protein 1-like n=1 Tax=Mytilus trossulus TaxID=6551 RepID=UPI003007385D
MKITVETDHKDNVWLVGSTLHGVVKVTVDKPTKLHSIVVHITGKGMTGNYKIREQWFGANEDYIDETIKIFGDDIEEYVTHSEGDYSYPFSVQLGADMPSSYEGELGFVRYTLKVSITKPYHDKKLKIPLTFIRHLACNEYADAMNPIVESVDKKVEGLCFCKCSEEGSMTVKLHVNKTAFVPGEPLIYEISVDNRSVNVIRHISFILRQNIVFTGFHNHQPANTPHFRTWKTKFKLCEFENDFKILANQGKTFNGAATIPAIPPTGLPGCNIIDIKYLVILLVDNSFTHVKFKKEVFIGTIPTTEESRSPAPLTTDDNALCTNDTGFALQPTVPLALPPSYAQCVFGKVDLKEDDDKDTTSYSNWAPSYTYYDWSQTTNYGGMAPITVTPDK